MASRPKCVVAWSSGKDSAWTLHRLRSEGAVEVVGLLTTLTDTYGRVAMHAVRERLLDVQADAVGLPLHKVWIPSPCPNEIYEARMAEAVARLVADGVGQMAFGDLFLADVRRYREEKLAGSGLAPVFPLWGEPTPTLAAAMVEGGLGAVLTCVDPQRLAPGFCGRTFDRRLLADLPPDVDPCGENGEFHSFVFAGPMFRRPLDIVTGETVTRDGFVFTDVLPAGDAESAWRS